MIKKIFIFIICFLSIFLLNGCGQNKKIEDLIKENNLISKEEIIEILEENNYQIKEKKIKDKNINFLEATNLSFASKENKKEKIFINYYIFENQENAKSFYNNEFQKFKTTYTEGWDTNYKTNDSNWIFSSYLSNEELYLKSLIQIKNIVFIQEGLPYEKYSNEIFDIISIINLFPTDDALVESGFDIEINKDNNVSNNETKEEEKIEVVKEEDLENFLINEGFIKTNNSIDTSIFLETNYVSYLKEGITIIYYKGEDAKKVYNKIKTINGGEITFTNGELGTGCIIKDDINFSANCLYQNKKSGVFIKYQEMNKDFAEKFIKIFGFSY